MFIIYLFVDVMMPKVPVFKLKMMLVFKIIKEMVELDWPGVGVQCLQDFRGAVVGDDVVHLEVMLLQIL